jgi:hypothetical protein
MERDAEPTDSLDHLTSHISHHCVMIMETIGTRMHELMSRSRMRDKDARANEQKQNEG